MGVASTLLLAPSLRAGVEHFIYDARLEEVLKALDPAHRLAELTSSWKKLSTTFGEKLQVNVSVILFFIFKVFFSFFSHSFSLKAYERDHSGFFGSGEVEKRLSIEVDTLKTKLASKISELDSVHQEQQTSEDGLRSQIIEADKRKETALSALQVASEQSDSK
jgi:hypothetical protein